MRLAFTAPEGVSREAIEKALKSPIERFDMKTALSDESRKKRIVILVSKFDHTLLHPLYQSPVGWLDVGPNLQWIRHPGARRDVRDVAVAGLKARLRL